MTYQSNPYFSEGKAEGRAVGLAEGERKKAHEMALKMHAKNKHLEEITEFTGLTESEIQALKKKRLQPQRHLTPFT